MRHAADFFAINDPNKTHAASVGVRFSHGSSDVGPLGAVSLTEATYTCLLVANAYGVAIMTSVYEMTRERLLAGAAEPRSTGSRRRGAVVSVSDVKSCARTTRYNR